MRSTVLFLFLVFFSFGLSGQTQEKIDSLNILLRSADDSKQRALLNLELARIYQRKNRDTSRFYSDTAERLALKIKDDSLLAAAYFRQAYPEYYNSNDVAALAFYSKIDSLAINNNRLQNIVIETKIFRSEISKFTFTMEGVLKAKEYLIEGLTLAQEIQNSYLQNKIKMHLGSWHGFIAQEVSPKKHLDSAKSLLLETLPYFKGIEDLEQIAATQERLASVFRKLKQEERAMYYADENIKTLRKIGDSLKIGEAYYMRGASYKRSSTPEIGLKYMDTAKMIYDKIGYPNVTEQKNLFRDYGYLYAAHEDYENAYDNMRQALVTSYEVYKEQNVKSSLEMEAKYETNRKQQEITLLKTQNALAEQQKKNQRNLLLGGLGLTTAAGIFLFLGFRNRKKTNNKLRELDATKSNFFANISHEFRTPLSLISGPIEEQLQKSNLEPEEQQKLQIAQRNSKRLVTLVEQLLDLSKLESGHFKLKIRQGNLETFLKSVMGSFEYIAKEKQQTYQIDVAIPKNNYWFDADALEKITTNLLANAIKYSPEGERIESRAHIQNNQLQLSIKNTGVSLPKEVLDTVFNRFQRAHEETAGAGIGLALTKELITLHKGDIHVKNNTDWMLFEVAIPVTAVAFSEEERYQGMIETPVDVDVSAFAKAKIPPHDCTKERDIFAKDTNPILLIVDDNADLREYVRSLFADSFTIHTAENGKVGFAKAQEVVPDLIITDLMMPEEDGLILTKNCKSTEATSHIPILMLTAKAGDENQLKGLDTGADAYITKPFNTEILKTTANNLLETRKQLQERFSQEIVLLPKDLATSSIEQKFLENLKNVLDESLVESDFSTEDFAQALGMSRMQLHRKLKALTGLSATEFIRSQRLKLAAQMLKKSDINVSQVGYSVGFNNHSYFTKCFKEQYGVAPSEYAQKL